MHDGIVEGALSNALYRYGTWEWPKLTSSDDSEVKHMFKVRYNKSLVHL